MGRYTAIRVGAMFFSYVADVFLFTISVLFLALVPYLRLARVFWLLDMA